MRDLAIKWVNAQEEENGWTRTANCRRVAHPESSENYVPCVGVIYL